MMQIHGSTQEHSDEACFDELDPKWSWIKKIYIFLCFNDILACDKLTLWRSVCWSSEGLPLLWAPWGVWTLMSREWSGIHLRHPIINHTSYWLLYQHQPWIYVKIKNRLTVHPSLWHKAIGIIFICGPGASPPITPNLMWPWKFV